VVKLHPRNSIGCMESIYTAVPVDIESRSSLPGLTRLDPAIHLFHKKMDARVKPAHDAEREVQFDRNPL
jgi:hypothetical protein